MREHKSRPLLLALAYLSFISLGLPDGVLGVAWPAVRRFFNLPIDALGPLLVMATLGYLLASFNCGRLLARMNVGVLLALSCAVTAISFIGYALTSEWWLLISLSALAGLGAGAIDTGLNTYAATHFSARAVNWLHASYGVGATLGPMIMTRALNAQQPWQWGYTIIGSAQLMLALCFGATNKLWTGDKSANTQTQHDDARSVSTPSTRSVFRLPAMWLGVAAFFFYAAIESVAGAWAFSLFTQSRGVSVLVAGTWTSVYWGTLTAGRLLSGFVVNHVPLPRLLRGSIIGIALGAVLMWLDLANAWSFLGLALIGFCCAPIFPSFVSTTPQRVGATHTAHAVGYQMTCAMLGLSLWPSLVGVLAKGFSLEIMPPALLVAAMLLFVLHEFLV
ncbi:MAG: MFS transporter, partial [candidate division KSB1 bacterium]